MTTIDWTTDTKGRGAYADVNGLHLYYQTPADYRDWLSATLRQQLLGR